jgi:osmotically-inducible protein OsmY
MSTAPTLAEPLTQPHVAANSTLGVGAGPARETGQGSSSQLANGQLELPPAPVLGSPSATQPGGLTAATPELGTRVRQTLLNSMPADITGTVQGRTGQDPLRNLDVEAVNGDITLRGDVRSQAEKTFMGQRVSRMQGVRSVNNQLRVISPTRPGMEDATSPVQRENNLLPEK